MGGSGPFVIASGRADQVSLRRKLFGPSTPQGRAALGSGPAPWMVSALPYALTSEDIAAAAQTLMTNTPVGRVRPPGASAARPITSAVLYGTNYDENRRRIGALAQMPLIAPEIIGRRGYPGILMPDPSEGNGDVRPLAVIGPTGYVGSVWNEDGTEMCKAVDTSLAEGFAYATLIEVEGDQVRAWLASGRYWQTKPARIRTPTAPGRSTIAKTGDRLVIVAAGKLTVASARSLGACLDELVSRLENLRSDVPIIGDEAAGRLLTARCAEFGITFASPTVATSSAISNLIDEVQIVSELLDQLVDEWSDADREERQDLKGDACMFAEELVKYLAGAGR
ncbi:MAG: hypothetical protein ACYCTH_06290 [Cellulomonas sp.]